jgi:AcrR family transcriptional regulator
MSELALKERAPPRKRDAAATRAAILQAAKGQFARLGYDRTGLRDIAAEAGVDVALVARYFGGKEGLFTEALKASFSPDGLSHWKRETFARDMAQMMAADARGQGERNESFQFLLRASTSPTTAPLLNVAVQERFLTPIREWLGDAPSAEATARARVLAAAFIGFLVERLIRDEPLAGREREAFLARAEALFETLIA